MVWSWFKKKRHQELPALILLPNPLDMEGVGLVIAVVVYYNQDYLSNKIFEHLLVD